MTGNFNMVSYFTNKGTLVVRYNPKADNFNQMLDEAERKHRGAKTIILVTPRTDFLKHENSKFQGVRHSR